MKKLCRAMTTPRQVFCLATSPSKNPAYRQSHLYSGFRYYQKDVWIGCVRPRRWPGEDFLPPIDAEMLGSVYAAALEASFGALAIPVRIYCRHCVLPRWRCAVKIQIRLFQCRFHCLIPTPLLPRHYGKSDARTKFYI